MICMGYMCCMEISGFIAKVLIRIHPNPRCLESWVGNTLFCIRGVRNPPLGMDSWFKVFGDMFGC